jgi:hypothetical protein
MKKFFRWVFSKEIAELEKTISNFNIAEKRLRNVLGNIDVSVDVHQYSRSWACISIQGVKDDYIKFVDLGHRDVYEISKFLRQFERDVNIKVDASPEVTRFLKFHR